MSEHKDYGGECYRCGGDWPCDYERGYRDALRQAADEFEPFTYMHKWLLARAEAVGDE